MNETYITILGNAVEEPVRRRTTSGDPYVTFRFASTVRRRKPGSTEFFDAGTSFVDVIAFRQLALNVAASVTKGAPLVVHGRMRVEQWTNGDRRGTNVEIEALSVGPDLRRGTSIFTRTGPVGADGRSGSTDHRGADGRTRQAGPFGPAFADPFQAASQPGGEPGAADGAGARHDDREAGGDGDGRTDGDDGYDGGHRDQRPHAGAESAA